MSEAITPEMKIELYAQAKRALQSSYSPYSGFAVGAALLSADDEIFAGTNIENASYGGTLCAERAAFAAAITAGVRDFKALMVISVNGAVTPCGICRQFAAEHCSPDFLIMTADSEEDITEYTLGQLLPEAFSKDSI